MQETRVRCTGKNAEMNEVPRILVALREDTQRHTVLQIGLQLAQACGAELVALVVHESELPPPWVHTIELPSFAQVWVRQERYPERAILAVARELNPTLLILGWRGRQSRGRYLLGRTLDRVLQEATCQVVVTNTQPLKAAQRILIPVAGGPHAPRGFFIAHALAPEAELVALYVASQSGGEWEERLGEERLATLLKQLPLDIAKQVRPRVVVAANPVSGILEEATRGYDLLLVGASGKEISGRFIFGDVSRAILFNAPIPTLIVRRNLPVLTSSLRYIGTRLFTFFPTLTEQEQAEVYKGLRRGARVNADFLVMIFLAAAIASLGLLLNSPAVIIGAMLVAPLMTAILGSGLAIVMGDLAFFAQALETTLRGAVLAILTGLCFGLLVPGPTITAEMLARTRPTLLDMGVALVSGAAAAYAISRPDLSAALAGVAIAAALAPPLTTVGLFLSMADIQHALGALLLFVTNLISIIAAGAGIFLLLGFYPHHLENTRLGFLQRGIRVVTVLLLAVAVMLGWFSWQDLRAVRLNKATEQALQSAFAGQGMAVTDWKITQSDTTVLHLKVTVHTANGITLESLHSAQTVLARQLGRPVALEVLVMPSFDLGVTWP